MAIFDVKILQRRGLGKRILALLASRHPLPEEGILAGQSVASAIDELYKLTPPIYNDIDVFLSGLQWQNQTGQPTIIYKAPSTKMLTSGVKFRAERQLTIEAEYARSFIISDRQLYTVRRARTDGLINRVWVDWYDYNYSNPERTPEPTAAGVAAALAARRAGELISGFDLNSTQVAVDIRSGQLFYTPAFAEFFSTRQLSIVCTFTPVQSLLRYMKKRHELECYGNDEAQIELTRRLVRMNEYDEAFRDERINTFLKGRVQFTQKAIKALTKRRSRYLSDSAHRVGMGLDGAPLAFGKKYAGLLDQYGNVLKPFFDTTQHPKKELFLFSSRDDAPALPERSELPSQQTSQPRRFWQLYLPAGKLTILRREAFKQFLEKLDASLARRYNGSYVLFGDDYLEGAESPSGMAELLTIVNAHYEVSQALVDSLSIGTQIEVIRIVRKALKKAKIPEAWGIFARKSPSWALKLIHHPDILDADIAQIKGSAEPAVDALPLPAQVRNVEIQELRSAKALREEGLRMHHCVGGYIHEVAQHQCRIVSLKGGISSTQCSTLEWAIVERPALKDAHKERFGANTPLQLALGQHHTFANRRPLEKLRIVEAQLRKDLNKWLLENPKEGYDLLWPGAWRS